MSSETLTTADGRPVLRIERRLAHPRDKVWRAITEPEQLSRWYPFRATALDLRIGGAIRFDDGHGTTMDAIVTELDPPRLFAFSSRAPSMMTRESEDLVRFELSPDGAGCRLVFTHIFDDRFAAASYASGWRVCLDGLAAVADGRPVEPAYPEPEMHDAYVEKFGLDEGTYSETADGWLVRFERQLTRPADRVWAGLLGAAGFRATEAGAEKGAAAGPPAGPGPERGAEPEQGAEPEPGGAVPPGFAHSKLAAGTVTSVKAPALLEYEWRSGDRPAGRVRWELSAGTGHGARLVLTQTGPKDLPAERSAALRAWRAHLARLAKALRTEPSTRR